MPTLPLCDHSFDSKTRGLERTTKAHNVECPKVDPLLSRISNQQSKFHRNPTETFWECDIRHIYSAYKNTIPYSLYDNVKFVRNMHRRFINMHDDVHRNDRIIYCVSLFANIVVN